MRFTRAENEYLRSQPLGRLATVSTDGTVQVNPVGFRVESDGTVVVGGRSLRSTRKFRNIAETGRAAIVIDDLASRDPWTVRGIEVRGRAEATVAAQPPLPGATSDVIRIHPDTVFTWGVEPGSTGMARRDDTG